VEHASPSVAVVICTYSDARRGELRAAIDSVLAQEPPPSETIVVVDYNPTLRVWIESQGLPIRLMDNSGPRGLSGARNEGLRSATSEIVAYIDDDASAEPGWLAELVRAFRDPRVGCAGGSATPVWERGRPGWFPEEFDWVVGCSYRGLPVEAAEVRNVLGCNMAFRRADLMALGGFSPRLGRVGSRPIGAEETEVCIRLGRSDSRCVIEFRPSARVQHLVPASRAHWRYFIARCFAEGVSKAVLSRMVGPGAGLATERRYAAVVLPQGMVRGVRDTLRGDLKGILRSFAIGAGLALTTAGYVRGLLARRSVA
jgi:O-antigen biosynthesis protein